MEGKDRKRSSSDESGTEKNPVSDANDQKNLLEEEIKKIISDLDIKFEDSPHEEEDTVRSVATGLSSSIPGSVEYPSDRRERIETQHLRAESVSTVSNATTVVHQRVPTKISVSHVKSERYNWPPAPQGNRLQENPQHQQRIPVESQGYYGGAEEPFYQPERDEITEPTTSETVHTTTENTTTSYAQSSTHQQPRPSPQHNFLPPLPEDRSLRDFRDVRETEIPPQQYHPHPFDISPNDYNAPLPAYNAYAGEPPTEPTRYPSQPMYYQGEPCSHQYYPQGFQDVGPHPGMTGQIQDPYQMQENVNRYNNTHMSYSTLREPERPGRRSITDYLVSKSRSFFNRREDSDSGEVIPQLYKACVKNGTCPPRFTFKAVTGIQPPYLGESVAPHRCSSVNQQNIPVLPNCDQVNGAQPSNEPANPCCCSQELSRKYSYNRSCGKNCEIATLAGNGKHGIKTKAYYDELGCGYISQGSVPEKVDIYCFDQLNTGFFRTSDHPPPLFSDIAIQRTEKYATVFWAEVYGVVNVATAFIIALLLQTFKFLLQGIVRPLMIGSVQLLSDYFIKPLLTLLYNGFTQPISIFFYNVVASIRDVMQPMAKGLGYFFELFAVILRAIRFVEVKNVTNITPCTPQAVKYC